MKPLRLPALYLLLITTAQAGIPGKDWTEASAAELREAYAAGTVNATTVTQALLNRIAAFDDAGPMLNAVVEINPEALAIAKALDEERTAKGLRGPLHGIPVLLKDNIDTADRMATTAGSLALVGIPPAARDAEVVRRLRAAGAIILGKTNLSEWANFRSTRSSSGWSGRGGQTKNAYAPERNPCGSSSGSGTAVAASFAPLAVGTETDGSVVCPSSLAALVGLKPTLGLVSRRGIIPISASQDTAGPMARSVTDAALLLQAMAGADPEDRATAVLAKHPVPDYLAGLKPGALKGVRIGVLRKMAGFHEGVDVVFEAALVTLKNAGAVIVDPIALPHQGQYDADEFTVLLYEFKDGLNRYLASRKDAPKDLAALIAFNKAHAAEELPYFQQEIFEQAQAKGPLTEAAYRKARARSLRLAGAEGLGAVLKASKLDALVAPTMGAAWMTDLVNGDHYLGGTASSAPAVSGYPHITVPMGAVQGLPVGLSLIGAPWSEAKLLGYAYGFEQAAAPRLVPALKPSR